MFGCQLFADAAGRYLDRSSGGSGSYLHPRRSGAVGQQDYRRENERAR